MNAAHPRLQGQGVHDGAQRGTAWYNEIDPFAVEWLTNLERAGLVAPGRIEPRSITELRAADVAGPGQRHFFAGIGGWSAALRRAGIGDDVPIWTGSCPCQPFSDAGKRRGTSDPRHLWPTWAALIEELRPAVIFAEQVASQDGLAWLDFVYRDLERCNYAVGTADFGAASIGAPHIRQRLYICALANDNERGRKILRATRLHDQWKPGDDAARRREIVELAHDASEGRESRRRSRIASDGRDPARIEPGRLRDAGAGSEAVDDTAGERRERGTRGRRKARDRAEQRGAARAELVGDAAGGPGDGGVRRGQEQANVDRESSRPSGERAPAPSALDETGPVGDADQGERGSHAQGSRALERRDPERDGGEGGEGRALGDAGSNGDPQHARAVPGHEGEHVDGTAIGDHSSVFAGATRGAWGDVEWLPCIDGVARPVEPGLEPLAHGVCGRVAIRVPVGSAKALSIPEALLAQATYERGTPEEGDFVVHWYNRAGALRGFGNAIVAEQGAIFIVATVDTCEEEEA